jgi:hypothetical protein
MTSRSTWKRTERVICEKLGGHRTPLSGSASQHKTSSDCIDTKYPDWYFEIKVRASLAHHRIFRERAELPAKKETKIPALITREKNKKEVLVTLRFDDFLDMLRMNDR